MPAQVGKASKSRQQDDPWKIVMIAFLGILIVGGGLWLTLKPESAGTKTGSKSTFQGISYVDGENIGKVEASIWTWDADKNYDEPEDLRRITNFEETVSSADIEDIEIDLTKYSYGVWIEIDPDGESVFQNDFIWLDTSVNVENYLLPLYHLSSDVNFNIVNQSSYTPISASLGENTKVAENFTLFYNFPGYTTTNIHANTDDWSCDDDEWDDMSDSEKEYYYDESNFRCQAPLYDIAVDSDKDYSTEYEKITSVFGYKFTFNTTISTIDGNTANVNMTVDADEYDDIDIQTSGTYIFMIFSDVIAAPGEIEFELELGQNIQLSNVHSGRITVAGDESSASWTTTYSALSTSSTTTTTSSESNTKELSIVFDTSAFDITNRTDSSSLLEEYDFDSDKEVYISSIEINIVDNCESFEELSQIMTGSGDCVKTLEIFGTDENSLSSDTVFNISMFENSYCYISIIKISNNTDPAYDQYGIGYEPMVMDPMAIPNLCDYSDTLTITLGAVEVFEDPEDPGYFEGEADITYTDGITTQILENADADPDLLWD